MSLVTLETITTKQSELDKLIQQFKEQALSMTMVYPRVDIELQPGEHYAGPVLDASGFIVHHLVLMAQRPTSKLNWQDAMDWATSVGGTLPSRQQQALLYANCKPHLKPEWHWSCEQHETEASFAWECTFSYGGQDDTRKSYEGSAVAVRLIPITA